MQPKKNPNVEIGRNSSLYFAIGLNIMLFLSWQILEYKTYEKKSTDIGVLVINSDDEFEEDIPIIKLNVGPPPPPAFLSHENTIIVDDASEVEETVIESSEATQEDRIIKYSSNTNAVNVSDIYVEEVEEDVDVPFAVIQNVPVFPGCEGGTESERKACFQKKIQDHVQKHFNYPEAALDLKIQGRVFVIFMIDSKGYVADLKSRGPDKILEKEAERIIGLLPKMTPGKQRGKSVRVAYSVPIYFKCEEG